MDTTTETVHETLYAALVAAGCDIDSHESDLYVRSTSESRRILKAWGKSGETFVSQIDGKAWIDVPFMFAPFWLRIARKAQQCHEVSQ